MAALSTVAALSGNYVTARAMANDVLAAGRAKDDPQIVALGYARLAYTACESGDEQAAIDACRGMARTCRTLQRCHWRRLGMADRRRHTAGWEIGHRVCL
ncbi:MAG: hypothetical protein R2855_13575 [Thermomicrobiales bacterium]